MSLHLRLSLLIILQLCLNNLQIAQNIHLLSPKPLLLLLLQERWRATGGLRAGFRKGCCIL
jgi:hypothetical protein